MTPSPLRLAYDARVDAGGIRPDPAQEAAIAAFDRLRAALEAAPEPERRREGFLGGLLGRAKAPPEPEGPRGVYLWGGVGRGKSMLMDLFVGTLEGVPARRVHFHAFMQEVHRGLGEARKRGVDDAVAPVADGIAEATRLLALDEMQIADITDAMIVGRLFERLLGAGVMVATTSNRPPGDLYKDGLNRPLFEPFIALIERRLEVVELRGAEDHRQGRTGSTYFAPVDRAAREAAQALWDEWAGGAPEPLALAVGGRTVEIPAHRDGVARARFWELCGRPLGAADYLALAQAARAVILEEVPRLSRSNFNEARRFVTLIDALYEARTRLAITAAADPDHLYVEGEGSFEFARTASRLHEMTSEGWGEDARA